MGSGEERRSGPFAMIYLPWIQVMARAGRDGTTRHGPRKGTLPNKHAVLLLLLTRRESDKHGNAWAWYPAAEMAATLGLSVGQVYEATRALRSDKLISIKEKGRRGHTTVYWLFPGIPWPAIGTREATSSEGDSLRFERPIAAGQTPTPHKNGARAGARPHKKGYRPLPQAVKDECEARRLTDRQNNPWEV